MRYRTSRYEATSVPCLVQYSGSKMGRRFDLPPGEWIIGCADGLLVVLCEDSVAENHARICLQSDTFAIEDIAGSSGTFVNEVRVQERATLQDGDIIRVGQIMLKFFAGKNFES